MQVKALMATSRSRSTQTSRTTPAPLFARRPSFTLTVARPNLLVKIPATKEGLTAIEEMTARGKSINVTLIFSLDRYAEVVEAYMRGLERLTEKAATPSPLPRSRASSSRA